jgi:hypothetical protein
MNGVTLRLSDISGRAALIAAPGRIAEAYTYYPPQALGTKLRYACFQ